MTSNEISQARLAAADPPAAGQARLCAGQGLAAAAGAGRGHGEGRGLCAAGQCRDARGLRLARQGDRRERRRGDRLRGSPRRRAVRSRAAGAVRCGARRGLPAHRRRGARGWRARLGDDAARRRAGRDRRPDGAAAQAARCRRRHRLLRRRRARTGGGPGVGPRGRACNRRTRPWQNERTADPPRRTRRPG